MYFEPRVAKAMHYATLVLNADGVMVPMTVALKGSSMAAAIVAQPALLKFSNTFLGSTTEPKSILLSNEGAQSIEIEIVAPTSEDFVVDLSSVKTTLGMGDSTRVPVQFAPKTTGMKAESVEIRPQGTQVSLAKIDLEGLGVVMPPPKMEGGCSMAPRSGSGLPLLGLSLLGLALLVLRRRRARKPRPEPTSGWPPRPPSPLLASSPIIDARHRIPPRGGERIPHLAAILVA